MFRKLFVAFTLFAWTLPLIAGEKNTHKLISELSVLIDQADEMVVYSEGFKREFVVYGGPRIARTLRNLSLR